MTIHTDGFGTSVMFVRRKIKEKAQQAVLELEDFSMEEVKQLFLPMAVDPGRKVVFTVAVVHSEDNKEFRSCSSKERQSFAGTDQRSQKVLKLKKATGIEDIKSRIPIQKTIDIDRMKLRIRYINKHSGDIPFL